MKKIYDYKIFKDNESKLKSLGLETLEDLYFLDDKMLKLILQNELGTRLKIMNKKEKLKNTIEKMREKESQKYIEMTKIYESLKKYEIPDPSRFAKIIGVDKKDMDLIVDFHKRMWGKSDKSKLEAEIVKNISIKRIPLRKIFHYIGQFESLYSNLFGICIGIDNYKKMDPLEGAVKSAEKFNEMLKKLNFNTNLLLNDNASTIEIGKALSDLRLRLEKLGDSDSLVVIYFSGHGYYEDDSYQICPHNFDKSNVVETGQNLMNLKNRMMGTFLCKHILFIFDCEFPENIFDGPLVKVQEFSNTNSFYHCNKTQKSIWGLCSNEKRKGKLADAMIDILSNKKEINTEKNNNFIDLHTLCMKIKKLSKEFSDPEVTYGSFSGSPIEMGVPMFPTLKQKDLRIYTTEGDINEALLISEEQKKKT